MPRARFDVWNEGGVLVAKLWDQATVEGHDSRELLRLLESHLEANGKPYVVFDFNHRESWLSDILASTLRIVRRLRNHGGIVVICHVEPHVRELFGITKVEQLFTFMSDLAEALAHLKNLERD